jgi:isopenicillin-N epimerase
LQKQLLQKYRIEVPVMIFPAPPRQLVRIAAQLYNTEAQFARLAAALKAELEEGAWNRT